MYLVKSCETILPTEPPVERRFLARVLAVTKSLHELQIEGKARGRTLGFFRRIWGVLLPQIPGDRSVVLADVAEHLGRQLASQVSFSRPVAALHGDFL